MAIDLSTMSRSELEKLKADVEKEIRRAGEREYKAAIAAAEEAVAKYGYSLADIAGGATGPKRSTAKSSGVAKYRNPDNTNQTWTGKGRQPEWFKAAIAAGKDPETMAI